MWLRSRPVETVLVQDDSSATPNTYKKTHPDEKSASATADTDMLTGLGAQGIVLVLVVLVKLWA